MKPTVAPYATRAVCLRIVCSNGLTIRLTRYPFDLKMSNDAVYLTGSGYDVTAYSSTSNLSPSAIDLEGFVGYAGVTRDTIASGIFDGARAYLFACNFLAPVEDYEEIVCSILGKTELVDDRYRIEEMALIDAMNQSVGRTYTALCSHTFGDADCGKNLAALTVVGTVNVVTSNSTVRDTSRSESVDYFAAGTITFTSGNNSGLKAQEIKSYAADGTITTFEPFYYTPQVGDTFTMTPGCRKRLEDCRDKWNNVVNRFAFDYIQTSTTYMQVGGTK